MPLQERFDRSTVGRLTEMLTDSSSNGIRKHKFVKNLNEQDEQLVLLSSITFDERNEEFKEYNPQAKILQFTLLKDHL